MSEPTMLVTFHGGPLDGDEMLLPVTQRYWRIPMSELPQSWQNDGSEQYVEALIDGMRCGVYAPAGKPTDFHWLGGEPRRNDATRLEKSERAELARLKAKYESPAPSRSPEPGDETS